MTSFRQVLAQHSPALLIDAASARIQVGCLDADPRRGKWQTSDAEAGNAIFQCIAGLEVDVNAAAAFIFCEGPGSILGVRTAAMALRTWNVLSPRPVFGYLSLAAVAHSLPDPELNVVADARRESWHLYRRGSSLQRVATGALPDRLVTPEHFRHWSALPPGVQTVSYDLEALLPSIADADVLHPVDHPDAFLHEEPNYVTWTPQIHRASASS